MVRRQSIFPGTKGKVTTHDSKLLSGKEISKRQRKKDLEKVHWRDSQVKEGGRGTVVCGGLNSSNLQERTDG